jgi:hypothetical protein
MEDYRSQVRWEEMKEANRCKQLTHAAEWRVRSCFGFLPNLTLSAHKNAREVMKSISPGCYFSKAMNTAFHDLTGGKSLPVAIKSLLGLSLKFIPTPRYSPSATDVAPSLDRIERDIGLRTFFAGRDHEETPKLRAKSTWRPPVPPQQVDYRVNNFLKGLKSILHRRTGKQNLTPYQRQLLKSLQENESVIIASADKNLGPVGIDVEQYIKLGLDHLLDPHTYELLTEDQAKKDTDDLWQDIYAWTVNHRSALPDDTVNFIREHLDKTKTDPLGYFYLTIKLHKQPITGRPVCSDCGSLPHALGRYVDGELQTIVRNQALYLKNSVVLKTDLEALSLPTNASLFTYDAVAMYPSINTADCLARLTGYLSKPEISGEYGFSPTALLEAIELVMFNNRMRFGDVIVRQLSGIAMGMSPAPTIANLYMAIYEETHVLKFIPSIILYLRRFIDDGVGIWLHDPNPTTDERNWMEFKNCLNASGLNWIFSDRSQEVIFMDLRLTIEGRQIKSSLYAKPMALHLYLPPHSCHAPGVLSGLVLGNVLRIHQLCSNEGDIMKELKLFFHRLLNRGYQSNQLTPLFQRAIDNAKAHIQRTALEHLRAKSKKETAHRRRVFLHLPYHPSNPSSKTIQKMWAKRVATPDNLLPLKSLTNEQGYNIPIEQLTIAWHRPPNLGNLLSYRRLKNRTGLKVSSFIKT